MALSIDIFRRRDRLWDWRLVNTGNHEIQATSGGQGFTERNDAIEGIRRVQEAIGGAFREENIRFIDDTEQGE